MVASLFFEENYEFINRNFAFSIIGWIYILTEIICLFQNGPSYKIECILHVQGGVFS